MKRLQDRLRAAVSGSQTQPQDNRPPPLPPPIPPRFKPAIPGNKPTVQLPTLQILSVTLSLENSCELAVESCLSDGQNYRITRHSLDKHLGNSNGTFKFGGENFSGSARRISALDTALFAELKTFDGHWYPDKVGIDIQFKPGTTDIEVKAVEYNPRHCPSLLNPRAGLLSGDGEDVVDLRLISNHLLAAECRQSDGRYTTSYINLSKYIGNQKGRFERGGKDFERSAREILLQDTSLTAKLSNNGKYREVSTIDVSRIVRCQGGRLVPYLISDYSTIDAPTPTDGKLSAEEFIPGCRSLRLVDDCIVVAKCRTKEGAYRESSFNINSIMGEHKNNLRLFYRDFSRRSKNNKLSGSILHVNLMQYTGTFPKPKIEKYEVRTIDLKNLLVNSDGHLVLSEHGNDCASCRGMFKAGKVYDPNWESHKHRINLPGSTACAICGLVEGVIRSVGSSLKECETWIDIDKSSSLTLELKIPGRSIMAYKMVLDNSATPKVPPAFDQLPPLAKTNYWFEPEKRWSLVHQWIDKCFHEHKPCQGTSRPRLPSRVLDLGGQEQDRIRILIKPEEISRYACLSHCWGGSQPCTLTNATYERYTNGFSVTELPRTYRDAIDVCRQLGLRYLWIDSLCILQDSKEDWLHESMKMVDYYGECHICIAATSAFGPNDGLNIAGRPTAIRATGRDPTGVEYGMLAYPAGAVHDVPHFSRADLFTLQQNFPLMQRAWVMQERWLSPRTLHFCGKEVLFECSKELLCECGHASEHYTDPEVDSSNGSRMMSIDNVNEGRVIRRNREGETRWTNLVSAYSSLELSFKEDRLPALSGLARNFSRSKSGTDAPLGRYLAGLWERNIIDELIWFTGGPLLKHGEKVPSPHDKPQKTYKDYQLAQKCRNKKYIAPTWSWANLLEPVRYRTYDDNKPLCELLEADVVLTGANGDPFGTVEEGCYLKLKGKLRASNWLVTGPDPSNPTAYILTDLVGTQKLDEFESQGLAFLPDYTLLSFDSRQQHKRHTLDAGEKLYVFPVLTQKIGMARWSFRPQDEQKVVDYFAYLNRIRNVICLVLRRSRVQIEGAGTVYERVGFTEYVRARAGELNGERNEYGEEEEFILV